MSVTDDNRARVRPYDFAILIGRFQPFHKGHESLLLRAMELGKHTIVLIGSAQRHEGRSLRNPFYADERDELIFRTFPGARHQGASSMYLQDVPHSNNAWVKQVIDKVKDLIYIHGKDEKAKVCLVGNSKADTEYLKWFPIWDCNLSEIDGPSATDLRNMYFDSEEGYQDKRLLKLVSAPVYQFLQEFAKTADYLKLVEERERAKHGRLSSAI